MNVNYFSGYFNINPYLNIKKMNITKWIINSQSFLHSQRLFKLRNIFFVDANKQTYNTITNRTYCVRKGRSIVCNAN